MTQDTTEQYIIEIGRHGFESAKAGRGREKSLIVNIVKPAKIVFF